MIRTMSVILLLLGGMGLVVLACRTASKPGGAAHMTEDVDAVSPSAGADAGANGDDSTDDVSPPAPQAYLRIAQLAPDLPPIDLCVSPHGTTAFLGPLLSRLAASVADEAGTYAGSAGLAFAQVSAYFPLDPGPYDVRLVAAGATTCSPSFPLAGAPDASDGGDDGAVAAGPPAGDGEVGDAETEDAGEASFGSKGTADWTDLPSLAFDTHSTLLIAGDWQASGTDPSLTVALLPDDAVLGGPAAVLRGVNAVPSWAAADFGLGSFGTDWTPILTDVLFAAASVHAGMDDGVVDACGYLPIPPQLGQAMGARPSSGDAGAALAIARGADIDLGSIATLIAVGGKTGDSTHPPALLLCTDNQPSGGLLSDCSVLP